MTEFTRKEPPAGPHPDGGWCSACDRDPEFHFYIPTTEEIRTEFCYDERNPVNNYGELFDRWLESVSSKEREAERERIIALLESFESYPRGWNHDDPFESIIKIIKDDNASQE